MSDYGTQLREKQKIRRMYGVLERQFRRYFDEAARRKGVDRREPAADARDRASTTSSTAWASARRAPRRASSCRTSSIEVNGKRREHPVGLCAPATWSRCAEKSKAQLRIKDSLQLAEKDGFPAWVEVDAKNFKGTFKGAPTAPSSARTSTRAWWSSSTRSNEATDGRARARQPHLARGTRMQSNATIS